MSSRMRKHTIGLDTEGIDPANKETATTSNYFKRLTDGLNQAEFLTMNLV